MSNFFDALMRDEDPEQIDPPKKGYQRAVVEESYGDDMTPLGREGRTEAKSQLVTSVGAGSSGHGVTTNDPPATNAVSERAVDASGRQVVDGSNLTYEQLKASEAAVEAAQAQAPGATVAPTTPATTPLPGTTAPVAAGTVPAAQAQPTALAPASQDADPNVATVSDIGPSDGMKAAQAPTSPATGAPAQPGPVSLAPANRQSWFINDSGQFSSGNQTQAGIDALERMDLKPDRAVLNRAITQVQQYNQTGESMHLDPNNPSFVKGWSPADYNNLVDWKMIKGIERDIDLNNPKDKADVEAWLGATFGPGNKGMHIDKLWGPHHVAAILEAAGQGGDNTPTPGDGPPPPERPKDPNEPEPDPYKDRYEEYFRNGMNPLLAYIGDEPKAIDTSRLRAVMGAQALGEGLRSIADVIHGPKGAPITEHKNNVTDWSIGKIDEAVKQFGSDKKEHRKMKLDALMYAMNSARNQANADKQDWRQGVAQMYDRFDKKVDRQDKQYKDLVDMYKWNKDFKLNVDKFASELQQKGLDRKQATELAIMQHGFRLQEQGQLMAHQAKLQKEAIEAGKYADNGNGTGGTGKHSTVTFIHKKADGTEVSGEASVPENISDKVNLALQKEAQTNDRLRADLYKLKSGLEKQGVPASRINRVILENYISNYYQYDPNTKTWSPVGGNTGGVATGANQSIVEQVNGSTAAPAKPATGQKPKLL